MKRTFLGTLMLVMFIVPMVFLAGCGGGNSQPNPPREYTLETPVIHWRANTGHGEIGISAFPGNVTQMVVRATSGGNVQEITIDNSWREINLTTIPELRTNDYYDIQIKLIGFWFDDGHSGTTWHDSDWSNTLRYYRVVQAPAIQNIRLIGGGNGHFRIAFDVEHITGFHYMSSITVKDSNGVEVPSLIINPSRRDPVNGVVTIDSTNNANLLNEYYTITVSLHLEWISSQHQGWFGYGRQLVGTATSEITVIRQHLPYADIVNATDTAFEWNAVEHTSNYIITVFGRNQFLNPVNRTITGTITDLSFCFVEYYERTGFDIFNWNTFSDGTNHWFYISIRPFAHIAVGNTLYLGAPTINTNSPYIQRFYLT